MYSRATSAAMMNGDAGEEDGVEDATVYKVILHSFIFYIVYMLLVASL